MNSKTHDPYSALRHGHYRRFLLGSLVGNLGGQAMSVAVGWHLYERTHSYLPLMLIGLSNYLPILFFGLLGGFAADHLNRKRILQVCTLACAAATAGLALLSLGNGPEWPWYLLLFLRATAIAVQTPASVSFYPTLLPKQALPNAVSWGSSNFQFGAIVGPALGGLLIKLGGASLALGFAALAPLFTFVMLWGLEPLRRVAGPLKNIGLWERLTGGLRFVFFQQKEISAAITLDLFAVLFGGVEGIMPAFASDVLHCGPIGLGFLKAALFLGALSMGFFLAHRPLGARPGRLMLWSVFGFGLCMITFGLSTNYALSFLALAAAGALDLVSVVVRQTLVQMRTPESLRGRVQAVNFLFIGTSNELGEAESGAAAYTIGAVPSVLVGGALTLLVVGLVAWRMPQLRKLGSLK